jgi:hypothetical protein
MNQLPQMTDNAADQASLRIILIRRLHSGRKVPTDVFVFGNILGRDHRHQLAEERNVVVIVKRSMEAIDDTVK